VGLVTLKLSPTDDYESAADAIAESHNTIKGLTGNTAAITETIQAADIVTSTVSGGSALLDSLESVVSKLDFLVKIIDKASKVVFCQFHCFVSIVYSQMKGPPICHLSLGHNFVLIQGKSYLFAHPRFIILTFSYRPLEDNLKQTSSLSTLSLPWIIYTHLSLQSKNYLQK
jgi:hypothetical protein